MLLKNNSKIEFLYSYIILYPHYLNLFISLCGLYVVYIDQTFIFTNRSYQLLFYQFLIFSIIYRKYLLTLNSIDFINSFIINR